MFLTRLISGAVLLVIAFASFWVGAPLLPVVLYTISLIGYLELTKALGVREEGKKASMLWKLLELPPLRCITDCFCSGTWMCWREGDSFICCSAWCYSFWGIVCLCAVVPEASGGTCYDVSLFFPVCAGDAVLY